MPTWTVPSKSERTPQSTAAEVLVHWMFQR
jgi:hypothetical protein